MIPGASWIDIGANWSHPRFDADRDFVLESADLAGVKISIATGTSLDVSRESLALAERYVGRLFATVGVHPHDARHFDASATALRAMAEHPLAVAVGECGLDFNRDFSPRPLQESAFAAQLEWAHALRKPVFLHERDAHARFLAILGEARPVEGVVHCFTGGEKEARAYLDRGLYLGVTGWICDERRGEALREATRLIPLDRLLLETDAPFLPPRDYRPRLSRNEPKTLPHIARRVAEIKGVTPEALAEATTRNARRLFRLPPASDPVETD